MAGGFRPGPMALVDTLVKCLGRGAGGADIPQGTKVIDESVNTAAILRGHGRGLRCRLQDLLKDVFGCDGHRLATEEIQHVRFSRGASRQAVGRIIEPPEALDAGAHVVERFFCPSQVAYGVIQFFQGALEFGAHFTIVDRKLVVVVHQRVEPDQEPIVFGRACCHVGLAGKPFVVALVAVEARCALAYAFTGAGANGVAVAEAGATVAVGAREPLLGRSRGRDHGEGE